MDKNEIVQIQALAISCCRILTWCVLILTIFLIKPVGSDEPDNTNELQIIIGTNLNFLDGIEAEEIYYDVDADLRTALYENILVPWEKEPVISIASRLVPSGIAMRFTQSRTSAVRDSTSRYFPSQTVVFFPISSTSQLPFPTDLSELQQERRFITQLDLTRVNFRIFWPVHTFRPDENRTNKTDIRITYIGELQSRVATGRLNVSTRELRDILGSPVDTVISVSERNLPRQQKTSWRGRFGVSTRVTGSKVSWELDYFGGENIFSPEIFRGRIIDSSYGLTIGGEVEKSPQTEGQIEFQVYLGKSIPIERLAGLLAKND